MYKAQIWAVGMLSDDFGKEFSNTSDSLEFISNNKSSLLKELADYFHVSQANFLKSYKEYNKTGQITGEYIEGSKQYHIIIRNGDDKAISILEN